MKILRVIFMLLCIFMINSQLCLARSSDASSDTKHKKHHKNKRDKKDKKHHKTKKHHKKAKKQKSKADNVEVQSHRAPRRAHGASHSEQVSHPAAIAGGASIHHQNEQEQENQEALEAYILANQNNNASNTNYTY